MKLYEEIIKYGKKAVDSNLTTSFFGNISARNGDNILISGTGTMLDELDSDSIVEVPVRGEGGLDKRASSELAAHRSIYHRTPYTAVLHSHTLYSILMGEFFVDEATFEISEVLPFLDSVPIVEGRSGSCELGEKVGEAICKNPVIIVKNHGVFAAADSLKQCYIYTAGLEFYSKEYVFKHMVKLLKQC